MGRLEGEGARKKAKALRPAKDEPKVVTDAPTAVLSTKPQTHWEAQIISMAIHRHSVLTDLTEDARDVLISRMKHYILEPDEVVFEQGSQGTTFFVIGSGEVDVLVNSQVVNRLRSGDSFGEVALLHHVPRSATVRSVNRCDLWGLDASTFREAVQQVNIRNYRENRSFIDSVGLFNALTDNEKEKLMSALSEQRFLQGKQVVTEGEPGDVFYLIKEGTVTCSQNGVEKRKMRKGEYFGEQALLYNTTRTATITADDTVRVLSIGRDQLSEVFGRSLQQILSRNTLRIAFDKSESLSKLTEEQKEKVIEGMKMRAVESGQSVYFPEESPCDFLVVLLKGEVIRGRVHYPVLAIFGLPDSLTEIEASSPGPLKAFDSSDIAIIGNDELERILKGTLEHTIRGNQVLALLKKVSVFRTLPTEKLRELTAVLRPAAYIDKQVIVRQGDPGDSLYIIESGQVQVIKDGLVLRVICREGFFGERALLTRELRTANVVALEQVTCLILRSEDFMRVMDSAITHLLQERLELQDDSVTLSQLVCIKELGKGMFGSVYLVSHRVKSTLYALKVISRRKVKAFDLYLNIRLERKVMLELDHIFITKLVKTFKDPYRVYFLMELVNGMDLFDAIRKIGNSYLRSIKRVRVQILHLLHPTNH